MDKKTYIKFSIFFSAVYFVSVNGLGALSNLPLSFLLKENLKLTPSQMAYFQAVMILSWVVKPLWGYISDSFPIFGYRRKSYLMFTSLACGLAWLALAGIQNYTVLLLLILLTVTSLSYAFQDVAADGLMVEVGQPHNLTGRFQSFQWAAVYLAIIITSLAGGYLAEGARTGKISYQLIFGVSAIFPFILLFMAWKLVDEVKASQIVREKIDLRTVFGQKEIWLLSIFFFLWTFSPSFGAPFFYYSVDTLKFDPAFMGQLQALAGACAFLTALAAGKWIDKIPMRKFLVFAIYAGVAVILIHQIYFFPWALQRLEWLRIFTVIIRIPLAIFEPFLFLMLVNLAARVCPQYAGGSVFALLMSFYNLGQMGSGIVGGVLYPHLGLQPLMIVSGLFSLMTLLVMPYLSIAEELTPTEKRIRGFLAAFKR